MEFEKMALNRQSTRKYDTTKEVELEKLIKICEVGMLAPSACNSQPWHFIVVDEPELKNRLADATSGKLLGINHFTKQAPIHIVVVEEKSNMTASFGAWVKDKNFAHLDVGIAAAHIVLAAEDEGLGSCIIGWFDEEKVRQLLHVPKGKRILLDIVVGYSTQPDRIKKRKDPKEMISYNQY